MEWVPKDYPRPITQLVVRRELFPLVSRLGSSIGFAGLSLMLFHRGLNGIAYSRPEDRDRDRDFYFRNGIFFVGFLLAAGLAEPDVQPDLCPDLCPAFNIKKDKQNEETLPDSRFIPQSIEFYAEDCQQLGDELFIHACTYHQYLAMQSHQLPAELKGTNSTSVDTQHLPCKGIRPEENEAVFLMTSDSDGYKFIETDSALITPSTLYVIRTPVHSYFISTDPVNRVSLCRTGSNLL